MTTKVAVIGATGFVGASVCEALAARGASVVVVHAPRLHEVPATQGRKDVLDGVSECVAVVNAAGISDAVGTDHNTLVSANSRLPELIAEVTYSIGARFIHVSSAAVQGRVSTLDDSRITRPFSPYSSSKADGERRVLAANPDAIIYRPPGVHGVNRSVTRSLARLASSGAASVAGNGSSPSPQALLGNVADAISFLALCQERPPSIVHHPSEGVTTRSLLEDLGGRTPKSIPVPLAATVLRAGLIIAGARPGLSGHVRRLETMWFGQFQARSWLQDVGWQPLLDTSAWKALGRQLRGTNEGDAQ